MNVLSLIENINKNQSWKDCLFKSNEFVTGVTPLKHISNLNDYMMDLIDQYGKHLSDHSELFFEMLPDEEQDKLLSYYIESINREIEWACYGNDNSINSEFLCSMLLMLKNNNKETREHFVKTIRNNLISYYKKPINKLLDSACDDYFHRMTIEYNYFARISRDDSNLMQGEY